MIIYKNPKTKGTKIKFNRKKKVQVFRAQQVQPYKFLINYTTHQEHSYIWQNNWKNLHIYYKSLLIFRLVKRYLQFCGNVTNKFYLNVNHNGLKLLTTAFATFPAYKTKKFTLQYERHLKHNKKLKALAVFIRNYIKVSYVKLSFYISYLPKNLIARNAFFIFRKYKEERFFWESLQITNSLFQGNASASILGGLVVAHTRRNPKRIAFVSYIKRLLIWHYNSVPNLGVVGVRLEVKGRFNAKSRSKKHIISCGRVNIHKKTSVVDYAFTNSFTKFGTLGIKVWVCSKN